MTRHGYGDTISVGIDLRVDLAQSLSSSFSLRLTSLDRVLKLIQGLSDWIGVAHLRIIQEGDIFNTPSDEVPCQLASKRPCTK